MGRCIAHARNGCISTSTLKFDMGALGGKIGKRWCDTDPNELVFTFGGSYFCANFDENRSRNATERVPTDGHTD